VVLRGARRGGAPVTTAVAAEALDAALVQEGAHGCPILPPACLLPRLLATAWCPHMSMH